ncbi:MAG: hypothetical protein FWC75_09330 [Oscillospiraceae bacterium]|nr:hypothetical protein [Oscillospiraceae bacterium]
MSELFDKRTDGAKRRDERTQKEQIARNKTRRTAILIVTAVAIVFAAALVINSNFIRRQATAVTIDGVSFSVTAFDYFYNNAVFEYHDFVQATMPEFASAMLPNRNQPFSGQVQNHETGETWADFFVEMALRNMSELVQFYNAARASGFVMPEESREMMEQQIAMMVQEGEMAAMQFPHIYHNPWTRLRELYGSSLNESTLSEIMEMVFTAMSFRENQWDSLTYTDAELESFYLDNRDDLDVFRYRVMLIEPETINPMDFEAGEGDAFADMQEEAAEEAVRRAHEIAAQITSQEDFMAFAREVNEVVYREEFSTRVEQQGELLTPTFRDWVFDGVRAYGDVTTIEASYGTYILFFIERDDNNYLMTSMRQILILRDPVLPEAFELGEDDPAFIEAVEAADLAARERAEAALAIFQVGGATEAHMISIMEELSDDFTPEGLYEDIARFPLHTENVRVMRVVPELEEWLFDESRQVGDYELIRTEAFGYHLMFFHAHGELFRHFIATDGLRTTDHEQWIENLPEITETHRHWAFILTQQ